MSENNDRSADDARRRVVEQRRAFQEALDAVRVRIEDGGTRVEQAVDRAMGTVERADAFVKQHPWICAAVGLGIGLALGRGRRSREARGTRIARLPTGEHVALVVQRPRSSALRSIAGMVAGAVARSVAAEIAQAILPSDVSKLGSDD